MTITLVVGVSTEERARELRNHLGQHAPVEVVWGSDEFRRSKLDAEFFPITAADRFGAVPVVDGAQILPTPSAERARLGLPKYIIAGGALSKPLNKGEALSAVLSSAIRAVAAYNNSSAEAPISRVGFWESWFNFDKIGISEVGKRLAQLSENDLLYSV